MEQNQDITTVFNLRDASNKLTFTKQVKDKFNAAILKEFDSIQISSTDIKIYNKTLAVISNQSPIFLSPVKDVLSESVKSFILQKIKEPTLSATTIANVSLSAEKEALLAMMNELQTFITRYDYNPFHNYAYRETLVRLSMKQIEPSYERISSKIDFITDTAAWGEVKSCLVSRNKKNQLSTGSFQFDKQNDPQRRNNTLKNDAFVFVPFEEMKESSGPVFLFYAKSVTSVSFIHGLIREKQTEFIKEQSAAELRGEQLGRDTISFTCLEILQCPELQIYDQNMKPVSAADALSSFRQNTEDAAA